MPAEFAGHVFEKIVEAGAGLGLSRWAASSPSTPCGWRRATATGATTSAREDTPLQAGLGFAVAFDKPGGFIGRDARAARDAGPAERRLVQARVATDGIRPHLHHNEPILRDGAIVDSVTTGAYGHRIGASLGMGYVSCPGGVSPDWLDTGSTGDRSRVETLPRPASAAPLV